MKDIAIFILSLSYCSVYLFVYLGWWFHRSSKNRKLKYSRRHLAFLGAMLPPLLLPLMVPIETVFVGLLVLLGTSSVFFSFSFIVNKLTAVEPQRKPLLFDPYLQLHNPKFQESKTKKETVFRILCLGGSTTMGPPTGSYPELLETLCQNHFPSIQIEVLNAGMAFYTTKHSLINYATYCRDWRPDLVVVMHAINDLVRSFSPPRYAIGPYNDEWTHWYGAVINAARQSGSTSKSSNGSNRLSLMQIPTHILQTLAETWYSDLRQECEENEPTRVAANFPLGNFVSIRPFERHLHAIVDFVQADGAEIVLATQASLFKEVMSSDEVKALRLPKNVCHSGLQCLSEEHGKAIYYASHQSLFRAMKAFNDVVTSVARSKEVALIDGANGIPKDLENFEDDVHYTVKGRSTLANLIASKIIENGYLDRKSGPKLRKVAQGPG